MLRFCLLLFALVLVVVPAGAQNTPVQEDPLRGIRGNSVSVLHTERDTLWAGPYLSRTTDAGARWFTPAIDSLFGTRNRVFSLDVEGPVIWAGLGYSIRGENAWVPAAGGFVYSTDGGLTFTYRYPPLDAPGDSAVTYGVSTLKARPVIVPEQSPPYDIDYDPATRTVWTAGWASGLRRSIDDGRTWKRVVLPPDDLTEIRPDQPYTFRLDPLEQRGGNLNHTAFSVLVDETGTIWAGTPVGVNRSTDGGQSWRRFSYDGTPGGLTGSWVIAIEEQPRPGRNTIWMATWAAAETGERSQDGVTLTRDGGQTFEQVLLGQQVADFAFRGDTVFVAGRQAGLFISADGGTTWRTVNDFTDATRPGHVVRPEVDVVSVAVAPGALWVGTTDGLFRSADGGRTFKAFRVDAPLHPATESALLPDVDTYAYPNPFSPAIDTFTRIRYEGTAGAEIRIFDFGMNLVRRLGPLDLTGETETTWDGTDDQGLRVANGVYLYAVRTGGKTHWGKILVLE